MVTVTDTEFARHFGKYRDAVQHEPVAVTSHEAITGYFVSAADFEQYTRLKARMNRAFLIEELPEETIKAIANSEMNPRHNHLNALLDE